MKCSHLDTDKASPACAYARGETNDLVERSFWNIYHNYRGVFYRPVQCHLLDRWLWLAHLRHWKYRHWIGSVCEQAPQCLH